MTEVTRSKWRRLIAQQVRSGKSVREFAAQHGVSAATLYWWRSRLRPQEEGKLIPVAIVDRPADVARDDLAFELCIGKATLSIPPGFDAEDLRRILQVLQC